MADLDAYRAKRRPGRTPEPAGRSSRRRGGDRFVIQEHHARALHWDFRLERDGVLVSWAVPKGLPLDRRTNRLAKQTEDHPLEYIDFAGEIPAGEYGGGRVAIWDAGRYELEKWSDDEVMVVLHGTRVEGRYVLFRTGGDQWMVHRMAEGAEDLEPLPEHVLPMLATSGTLPKADAGWGFEFKWDGVRALAYVDGGRVHLRSRNDRDVTVSYPELRPLGEALGARPALLDGEIVALDDEGRPSFGALQERMHVVEPARARRLAAKTPVAFLAFDLLHLDGRPTVSAPYEERRRLLEGLALAGDHWQTPPWFEGGGAGVLAAAGDSRLEGVVAKRLGSPYQPGRRTSDWVKVKRVRTQEVVVVGWTPGDGRRAGRLGALLVAVPRDGTLGYAGKVGTGFNDATLDDLGGRLGPLERPDPPLPGPFPRAQVAGAHWVDPLLVGEVAFGEWTSQGRLRHPSWRGLRPDKAPAEVEVEP